jgi:hypothetical protein
MFEAKRSHCPNTARVFVQHPISNATRAEIEKKADDAFEEIVKCLTTEVEYSSTTLDNEKEVSSTSAVVVEEECSA